MRPACLLVAVSACAAAAPPRPMTPACPCSQPEPVIEVEYESRPLWRSFLPFGAGQFQNDQPGKGTAFAVSQGITAATSAAIWIYLTRRYQDGVVPVDEGVRVRSLQQLEVVSGVAFLGLVAWGVVDALAHHQPVVVHERPSWTLGPTLVPDGAGIGVSWSR